MSVKSLLLLFAAPEVLACKVRTRRIMGAEGSHVEPSPLWQSFRFLRLALFLPLCSLPELHLTVSSFLSLCVCYAEGTLSLLQLAKVSVAVAVRGRFL